MAILRRVALIFGLLCGLAASQLPEFVQQYRQRLGGALDELTGVVAQFHGEAVAHGLSDAQAVQSLQANADSLARGRGAAMAQMIARRDRLLDQAERFDKDPPLVRLFDFAGNVDPQIVARAWAQFEPAVPVTQEGFICAGVGTIAGYGAMRLLLRLLLAPFGRRRRKTTMA